MKTQFTYRAYNEHGLMIDVIKISGSIVKARNIFRTKWAGYLKITCDQSEQTIISTK